MLTQYKSNHKTIEKNTMMKSKAYANHVQLKEVKVLPIYQSRESSDVIIQNVYKRSYNADDQCKTCK